MNISNLYFFDQWASLRDDVAGSDIAATDLLNCTTALVATAAIALVGLFFARRRQTTASAIQNVVHKPNLGSPDAFNLDIAKVNEVDKYCFVNVFNRETNRIEPSIIVCTEECEGITNWSMYTSSSKRIGSMQLYHFGELDSTKHGVSFGCPGLITQFTSRSSYADEEGTHDKCEVNELKNSDSAKYKYVGYGLMKAALQKYGGEVDYHFDLDAAWASPGFYWKLGFRANESAKNQKIAEWSKAPSTANSAGCIKMHLPDWARLHWKQEIQDNPLPLVHTS